MNELEKNIKQIQREYNEFLNVVPFAHYRIDCMESSEIFARKLKTLFSEFVEISLKDEYRSSIAEHLMSENLKDCDKKK